MPRKPLIYSADYPYHVTNRSNNKELFYLDLDQLWLIFLNCLSELTIQYGCEIHSFVLMSNHYHLIISTPQSNLGEAMKYLHREVARQANDLCGRVNHFFGGRYKWSLISHENYFWNCLKYVYRNPVRAKICGDVREYRFSSLNSKSDQFDWKISDYFKDPHKPIELDISWLNKPTPAETEVLIRKGLRRTIFQLPRAGGGKAAMLDTGPCKKETVT